MTIEEIKKQAIKSARKIKKEDVEEAIKFYKEDKETNAKEMFHKLGYKVRENEDEIYYYKDYDEHEVMMTYWKEHVFIQFVKPNGSIVQNSMHCGIKYYHKDDDKNCWYETLFLSKKELQAINQQCKELGWI